MSSTDRGIAMSNDVIDDVIQSYGGVGTQSTLLRLPQSLENEKYDNVHMITEKIH